MRVKKSKEDKETTVLFFYRDRLPPEIHAAIKELEELLGLRPGLNELNVTYGIIPETDQELTMQTRSMLQIMIAMATQIDVPPGHVEDGRTVPSLTRPGAQKTSSGKLVNIHTTKHKSDNAFGSVKYRDYWFWIDDRDYLSKRTFAFLMILFSLTESGGKSGLPLVTIPAG